MKILPRLPLCDSAQRRSSWFALLGAITVGTSSLFLTPKLQAAEVLTQHNDQWRTGANTSETQLTTANVNATQFGKLFSYPVDGNVNAQPLYVSGLTIAGSPHNVVYVVTMEDSVYAFDADSNTTYWHKQFTGGNITPVPIVDITGNNNLNIHGNVGILSTPVIDRASSTIYLLARTKNTSTTTYIQTLHALDLATGNEKFGGPVTISTAGFDAKMQNQRPGLVLANGNIYICWGSHEDLTPYHGWVLAYNATTLAQAAVFNTTPGGSQGAIWMAGQAPAVDQSGNLYLITGNGDWNGTTRWGQSFLKLSPTLAVLDWFTPDNFASMNSGDVDFGAAGPLLLPTATGYPNTAYVIGGGKEGKLFLLDKSRSMGHQTAGNTGASQIWQAIQTAACTHHIHGSPVYWNSGSQGQMIYVWGENDTGKAFKFSGSNFTTTAFTQTTAKSPTTGCGMPGSILSLSANGNANGIIWANCVYTGDAIHDIVPGILRAYDANNLGTELWNSRMSLARDDLGNLAKYVPPTIANGKVYMATFSGTVCVYGLLGNGSALADGTYRVINRNSGQALDANKAGITNGTLIDQFPYQAHANQQWTVTGLGSGQYKIIGVQSGLSLDVTGASTANGVPINLYTYQGHANQQWVIAPASGGYYTIQGVQSGKLLEVVGSATTNSAPVDQWSSTGASNQQWLFQAP